MSSGNEKEKAEITGIRCALLISTLTARSGTWHMEAPFVLWACVSRSQEERGVALQQRDDNCSGLPFLPPASWKCVTLDKRLHLSKPQFLCLQPGAH